MSAQLDNDDELFPAPPEPRDPTAFQRFCKRIGLRISRWIVEHCEVINLTFIEAIVLQYLDASDIGRRIATQQMAIEATDIAQAELDRLVRRSFKSVRAEQSNLQALIAKQRDEIAQLRGRLNAHTELLRPTNAAASPDRIEGDRRYCRKCGERVNRAIVPETNALALFNMDGIFLHAFTCRAEPENKPTSIERLYPEVQHCAVCSATVVRRRVPFTSETALYDSSGPYIGQPHEKTCKGFTPKVQE